MKIFSYHTYNYYINDELEINIRNKINVNSDLIEYLSQSIDYSKNMDEEIHLLHINNILVHIFYIIDPSYKFYEHVKFIIDFYFLESNTLFGSNKFNNYKLTLILDHLRNLKNFTSKNDYI